MRILLVGDDRKRAAFIKRGLKEAHYVVDMTDDGKETLFLAEINPYDLIILNGVFGEEEGIYICKELRTKRIDAPILILGAKGGLKYKVPGLDAGADDYLAEPFAFEEFLARVRALLRRKRVDKVTILKIGDLEVDQLTHKVRRAGAEISLTSKEYALLEYLMLHANELVTRTMICEHVWDRDFDSFTNVIDVYINYLRNKIDKGFKKPFIHTVRGRGYILKE